MTNKKPKYTQNFKSRFVTHLEKERYVKQRSPLFRFRGPKSHGRKKPQGLVQVFDKSWTKFTGHGGGKCAKIQKGGHLQVKETIPSDTLISRLPVSRTVRKYIPIV